MTGHSPPHQTDPFFRAAREAADLGRETGNRAMTYISIASVALGAVSTVAAVGLSLYRDLRRDQRNTDKNHDKMIELLEKINHKLANQEKGYSR